ncbi:ATP-binding protein [Catellatospora methionotrophica]|uniref:ATP-binding protein n=1 Tax=Catellatospora methionotrophica TaxID=121620 RepID=UPI0033E8A6C5
MNEDERRALAALRFDWSPTREDVWGPPEAHVDGMNTDIARSLLETFAKAVASQGPSPLGLVVEGQHGSGKTHLLSWTREQIQQQGGYFFLLGLPRGRDFWHTMAQTYLDGLARPAIKHPDQLTMLLDGLSDHAAVPEDLRDQVTGRQPLTRGGLDDFVRLVRQAERSMGRETRDTLRALVLLNAADDDLKDIGEAFLTSRSDGAAEEWSGWGLPSQANPSHETVGEISRLMALTGPSLLAVDQIDTAFAHVSNSTVSHAEPGYGVQPATKQLAEEIGHGLMEAREVLFRTVTVVACLATTWQLIRTHALESIPDRFRQASRMARIPSAQVGIELVAARFLPRFAALGFVAPHPTWPVDPAAFHDAPDYTPRSLFQRIDDHVERCLRRDEVVPLTDFGQRFAAPVSPPAEPVISAAKVADLDSRFAALRAEAAVDLALAGDHEDSEMPALLVAGLEAWTREQGPDRGRYAVMSGAGGRSVHATLRETIDADTANYRLWFFRGLARTNALAVLSRIERIKEHAALDPAAPDRKAFILRNVAWPNGKVTAQRIQEFKAAGGRHELADPADLRTFSALATMMVEKDPQLDAWLAQRRPASGTLLFTAVFGPQPGAGSTSPEPDGSPDSGPTRATSAKTPPSHAADGAPAADPHPVPPEVPVTRDAALTLTLGEELGAGASVTIPLIGLRKHTAIFAGSGSGKTVLIRRLIEECALRGVSTIALDPNNDLARLGDPWPQPPRTWRAGDADRARRYLEGTDVVVWTPRRESGRPLSLQPLPDFGTVLDDPDEFGLALDSAVAALAPRARMDGSTAKADRGRAVLREALAYCARRGESGLTALIDLLAELPEEVTSLGKATDLAYEMSQTLTAAMINDPLFGGSGVPLDPGVLMTPPPGKRARISVISMVGLPSNEQRQSFVNQLQMALFAWIKQNPAGERPLSGLFVMDEAQTLAPSGAMTACTESTLALASQARKYGLGLIFATQAPRGIHNRIVGNAATQLFGFLNSPVQITAAKEMAQAKAGDVLDISRLSAGEFYAAGEGMPFQKLATPMCLSHHPSSALTTEEVLERARS